MSSYNRKNLNLRRCVSKRGTFVEPHIVRSQSFVVSNISHGSGHGRQHSWRRNRSIRRRAGWSAGYRHESANQLPRKTVTNGSGEYVVSSLPIGTYESRLRSHRIQNRHREPHRAYCQSTCPRGLHHADWRRGSGRRSHKQRSSAQDRYVRKSVRSLPAKSSKRFLPWIEIL